jgi:predicted NAD-dependent protein-ADP-ribosyltransferase YbiA (DUF1768 family)
MPVDVAHHQAFLGERDNARLLVGPAGGVVKALGRQVLGFDEERWEQYRFDALVTGDMAKFGQHPQLWDFPASTGSRLLVEASRSTASGAPSWPPTTARPHPRNAVQG